ncbi:MAG: glycoside hydrolase family 15 protein [Actinomycetota bacterium]
MSRPIEHYGLIGDTETAALVGADGSIDWLCLPRFDSGACFAALLGGPEHGRWRIAPADAGAATRRRYRGDTLVLETEFRTGTGAARLIDFMSPRPDTQSGEIDLVRIVEGISGQVEMEMELAIRFDYGSVVPWVTRREGRLQAVAGPDALTLDTPVETRGEDLRTVAEFTVREGQQVPFVLAWHPSHLPAPDPIDARATLSHTQDWWETWISRCRFQGEHREAVFRSLITLKALTYRPTGGILAAPTTSLPEELGGVRNWDYRYVWSSPVRIGNAASVQTQMDVYGEVIDALWLARSHGLEPEQGAWELQRSLLEYLEGNWQAPDHGLWEMRGPRRAFTHSRVMSWVAFDRAVRTVERSRLEGPVERWREIRREIRADVLAHGYDSNRNTFVQTYGAEEVDAALLLIPQVGFLPPTDPRVRGTIDAVIEDLGVDDILVRRYANEAVDDGLPGGEGAFLLCSFWLVDALALAGRVPEARRRFRGLLDLRNDLGLLSEEYDVAGGRMLGNFPQAFSHVGLIDCAHTLQDVTKSAAASRGGIGPHGD